MPPAGFQPSIPAIERPQIYALDRLVPESASAGLRIRFPDVLLISHVISQELQLSLRIFHSFMCGSEWLATE